MNTRLFTQEELNNAFSKVFLGVTDKVTKVSANSVLSGLTNAFSSLVQKSLKENALVESYLDPDQATGERLDQVALQRGLGGRQAVPLGSSVYLRLEADAGTQYTTDHSFTGSHGVVFRLQENYTMNNRRFAYRLATTESTGEGTNVQPFTILQLQEMLEGHVSVVNDVRAFGGRDAENDDQLRWRIRNYGNIAAISSIMKLSIFANSINNNVFRLFHLRNSVRGVVLGVITHSGVPLSDEDLTSLREQLIEFSAINDSTLELENTQPTALFISARVALSIEMNYEALLNRLQINFEDLFRGYLYSGVGQNIDPTTLQNILYRETAITSVSSTGFQPSNSFFVPVGIPLRLAGMELRSLEGDILTSTSQMTEEYTTYYNQERSFVLTRNFLEGILG